MRLSGSVVAAAVAALTQLGGCAGRSASNGVDPLGASENLKPRAEPTLRLPATVEPRRYRAELAIRPADSMFSGSIEIDVEVAAPASVFWLNATRLEIARAAVIADGMTYDASARVVGDDFLAIETTSAIAAGPATLKIEYRGRHEDEKTEGLYRVKEPDGTWFSYTKFEPIMARRVFPSFDEPRFKVPWQLSFRIADDQVVVANTAKSGEQQNADGTKTVAFAPTRSLPSYLIAFIVGPFEIVEAGAVGAAKVPLRFVLPPGHADELGYAKEVTPRIVALLEDQIGVAYPFSKLDVAVVPRFWGTMEHPGIVALGQPLTLIKPGEDTIARRIGYANIAIHELCHYWYGDLVTMAWWDDVWLNESFGTWCDLKATHRLEPTWGFDLRAISSRESGFSADGLASVKRIREPAETKEAVESSLSNAITYSKGAAVIQMLEHWVGEAAFRRILATYLEKHAWKTATSESLAGVLDGAKDGLGSALLSFVDQPGAPQISMSLRCEAGNKPALAMQQQRYVTLSSKVEPAAQLWKVPVCFRYGDDKADHAQCSLLEARAKVVPLDQATDCPRWFVGNARGTGYYRVTYGDATANLVDAASARWASPAEKLAIVYDTIAAVESGALDAGAALALAPALAKAKERDFVYAAGWIVSAVKEMVPTDKRAAYARLVRELFGQRARALGWTVRPGEPQNDSLVRYFLLAVVGIDGADSEIVRAARDYTRRYLADPASVPPEAVDVALTIAATQGDKELFDAFEAAARGATDHRARRRFLGKLGSFRAPALVDRALAIVASTEWDLRDTRAILSGAASVPANRRRVWRFTTKNFSALAERMTGTYIKQYLIRPARLFCDQAGLDDAKAFYTPRLADIPGTRLALNNELDKIRDCIAYRARHQASVKAFFESR